MPRIALTMRTLKDTKELVVKLDVGEDVLRWSAGAPGGLLSRKAAEGAKQAESATWWQERVLPHTGCSVQLPRASRTEREELAGHASGTESRRNCSINEVVFALVRIDFLQPRDLSIFRLGLQDRSRLFI